MTSLINTRMTLLTIECGQSHLTIYNKPTYGTSVKLLPNNKIFLQHYATFDVIYDQLRRQKYEPKANVNAPERKNIAGI